MGKKKRIRKEAEQARQRSEALANEKKEARKNRPKRSLTKRAKVLWALLALVLFLGAVLGTVALVRRFTPFSYMTEDLSRYISLDPSAYRDLQLEISLDAVTDQRVEEAIRKVLVQYKSEAPLEGGKAFLDRPIKVGDVVYLYYSGYALDENGERVFVSGTNNMSDKNPTSLEIGSGSFVSGFEAGLVGMVPKDYPTVKQYREGTVAADSVVYVSYTVYEADGSRRVISNRRIDLSEDVDALFGQGFRAALVGAAIGVTLPAVTTTGAEVDTLYEGLIVNAMTVGEEQCLTVKTYFPEDYQSAELQQKTVYFDVFITGVVGYETPELTEDFIKNTLKLEEELSDYPGQTLIDRYRAYVRAPLEKIYEQNKTLAIEDTLMSKLAELATVKRYPTYEVNKLKENYLYQLQQEYRSSTKAQQYTFDQFCVLWLELTGGESVDEFLLEQARATVKEKLLLYYVMKTEGFVPTDKELAALREESIEEMVQTYMESNGVTKEIYPDPEEFRAAKEKLRQDLVEYYGEETFTVDAYYRHVIPKLAALSQLTVHHPNAQ